MGGQAKALPGVEILCSAGKSELVVERFFECLQVHPNPPLYLRALGARSPAPTAAASKMSVSSTRLRGRKEGNQPF